MPDTSNCKEPKRKFALWIRESILDEVRKIYKSDLSSIVTSTLKGIVAETQTSAATSATSPPMRVWKR